MRPHNTMKVLSVLKELHGHMTTNVNEARGNWGHCNSEELYKIENACLDIVEMCQEIRELQRARYGKESDHASSATE